MSTTFLLGALANQYVQTHVPLPRHSGRDHQVLQVQGRNHADLLGFPRRRD